MKKRETLSRGEQMLAQVLEECLEEDLSFVPPEREIARTHSFSEKFEEAMRILLAHSSDSIRQKEIRKHFSPQYGQWVACILAFCICGGLFYYVIRPIDKSGMTESASEEQGAAFDVSDYGSSLEETSEEAAEAEVTEAMEAEPAEAAEEAAGKDTDEGGTQKKRTYCGKTVYLADRQEIPETLEYVTTLLNCPVLDEENPVLFLTIGNTGEEEVQYLNRYILEVWLENGWYVIPPKEEKQEQWLSLEPGMAVDEEIDLSAYEIDYGAQKYRLVTQIGEDLVSAGFTFEEMFTETMERLEEDSGE